MSDQFPRQSRLVAGSMAAAIGVSTFLGGCGESPAAPEPLATIESQEDIRKATIAYVGSIACILSAESTGAESVYGGESLDNDVFGPDADGAVPEGFKQPVLARATRQGAEPTILFTAGPGRDSEKSAPTVSIKIGLLNTHPLATEPLTKELVSEPLIENDFDPLNLTVRSSDGEVTASIIDDRGRFAVHEDGQELTSEDIRDWSSETAATLELLADDAGLPECKPKIS